MKNYILIGFMGAGKTSVGKRMAKWHRMNFIDTDKWIEKNEGRTIKEIFEKDGEEYFRGLETKTLQGFVDHPFEKPTIISVGGGLPVRKENRDLLKKIGHVIYLKASADVIYERVKWDTKRPLLQVADPKKKIEELMQAREGAYLDASTHVIDVDDKSFSKVVNEIMRKTKKGR